MHVFIWKYYFIPCFRVSATHYLLVRLFSWCTQYNNSQPSECRKYLVYRVLVFTQSAGLQCLWEIARWGSFGGEKENHSKCKAMIHATDSVQTKIISPQTPPLTSPFQSTQFWLALNGAQKLVLHYSKYVARDSCEVGGLHSLSLHPLRLIDIMRWNLIMPTGVWECACACMFVWWGLWG